MANDIRFRAWHKQFKLMKRVRKLDLDYDCVFVAIDSSKRQKTELNRIRWNFNNIDIMQASGQLDKDDEDIYEKDIIRLGGKDIFYVKYMKGVYFLCWDQKSYGVIIKHHDRYLGEFIPSEIEVIGNMYEHEELLNDSKI